MANEYKTWPTSVVVSAATGKLVCEIGDLYKFYDWMTGDHGMSTIGIAICHPTVNTSVLGQIPELIEAVQEKDSVDEENWEDWLTRWIGRYGPELKIWREMLK